MNMRKLLGAAGVACFMTICSGGVFGMGKVSLFEVYGEGVKATADVQVLQDAGSLTATANSKLEKAVGVFQNGGGNFGNLGAEHQKIFCYLAEKFNKASAVTGPSVQTPKTIDEVREEMAEEYEEVLDILADSGKFAVLSKVMVEASQNPAIDVSQSIVKANHADHEKGEGMYAKIGGFGVWGFHKYGKDGTFESGKFRDFVNFCEKGTNSRDFNSLLSYVSLFVEDTVLPDDIEVNGKKSDELMRDPDISADISADTGLYGRVLKMYLEKHNVNDTDNVLTAMGKDLDENAGLELLKKARGFVNKGPALNPALKQKILQRFKQFSVWALGAKRANDSLGAYPGYVDITNELNQLQ